MQPMPGGRGEESEKSVEEGKWKQAEDQIKRLSRFQWKGAGGSPVKTSADNALNFGAIWSTQFYEAA